MVKIRVNGKVIPDVQLMIFDKDGTLMELYHYWSQMVGLRAKLIGQKLGLGEEYQNNLLYEMGVDFKAGRLRPEGPVGLKKREIVLKAAVDYLTSIGYDKPDSLCFDVFNEVDRISSTNLKQFIKPIDGAGNLINSLSREGCKVAIATTDKTARAKLAMEFLGFADKIDMVAGADIVTRSKPDPEMIYLILDTLDIGRTNAVMVGDAITDVQMGINANLKASIGVLTGFTSFQQLKDITPYIANRVSELKVMS